ncbi:peptidase domain-containing ABC transporter [Maribacter sp. 2307ULW6-5]|uniref:peptidase domain-containing ABC transporter n=1 Tax=Maribacter sp. 2307ULW6-5 TaxID=3386275 RepID=UPI0039BC24E6
MEALKCMGAIDFQHIAQLDGMDCGPACLKAIAKYHGRDLPLHQIRNLSYLNAEGISLAGISKAATFFGLESFCVRIDWNELQSSLTGPCMVHWKGNHFIVVYRITEGFVHVSDPAMGNQKVSISMFLEGWLNSGDQGVVVFLEPNASFYTPDHLSETSTTGNHLMHHFFSHVKSIHQVFIALVLVSAIQLTLPFLTQSLVDYGITYQHHQFIWVVLLSQLMLVGVQAFLQLVRDWNLLQVSTNVSLQLINGFLVHLVGLPMMYFSSRSEGDLLQRIADNEVLEEFVSDGALGVLFDMFSLLLFALVLGFFSFNLLMVYAVGTMFYLMWVLIFMKERAVLDKAFFRANSTVTSKLLQMLRHMEDVKINGSFGRRLGNWQQAQRNQYLLNGRLMKLKQYQVTIGNVIHQIKNFILLFLAAKMVMGGTMTLGTLLAILFIIAQMNVPLKNLTQFILDFQRVRLAYERLGEIESEPLENTGDGQVEVMHRTIALKKLHFDFDSSDEGFSLKNLNLTIPKGKVTAIVGTSGAGKTTLLKLLLGFYKPMGGAILIGNAAHANCSMDAWRARCGVVLQEGNLFEDTIRNNITEGRSDEPFNPERYDKAVKAALLTSFIEGLPYQNETLLGAGGIRTSGGEKQRVLMARALYKDADYLFLDEPTSALDAHTERMLMDNVLEACKEKTVVVIAHRLSTIVNADQIVVMGQGRCLEVGGHRELLEKRGMYHNLIKNQLNYVEH